MRDELLQQLPRDIQRKIYFLATQKYRDAAVRIQKHWRGYEKRMVIRIGRVLLTLVPALGTYIQLIDVEPVVVP